MQRERYYVTFKTAAGWMGIVGSAAGIKYTTLPQPSQQRALTALNIDTAKATQSNTQYHELVKRFEVYFNGNKVDFPDKLDLSDAAPFQRSVWEATRRIPYGETRSYAWVATQIDNSRAARAVGQALNKNPLPIIIPCHRVVKSDGTLGGFGGGLAMKNRLLSLEKGN